MLDKGKWYDVKEESRQYTYLGGRAITIHGVTRLRVSTSGTHYLEHSGGKAIVVPGWVLINIIGDWVDP